jgi:hypothetical protein
MIRSTKLRDGLLQRLEECESWLISQVNEQTCDTPDREAMEVEQVLAYVQVSMMNLSHHPRSMGRPLGMPPSDEEVRPQITTDSDGNLRYDDSLDVRRCCYQDCSEPATCWRGPTPYCSRHAEAR